MTSIFCRKAIASPCSAQPKQWKVPWLARTVKEGVFSSWNGQRPFCAPAPAERSATYSPTTSSTPPQPPGPAVAALATLPVKGRAPKTGYARAQFGPAWADTDHDGCDQRNQVLGRDLTAVVKRGRCVVVTGLLHDPYTDTAVPFIRGTLTSDDVQIDHVVALSNAWQTGAQALDVYQRELIATDPLNLLAVDGATNQSKGDGAAPTCSASATGSPGRSPTPRTPCRRPGCAGTPRAMTSVTSARG